MPRLWASAGDAGSIEWPSSCISPVSRRYTPVRTLIRVDLPAPFSPIKAWTSPRRAVKSTFESALTPGKLLLTVRRRRSGESGVKATVLARSVAGAWNLPFENSGRKAWSQLSFDAQARCLHFLETHPVILIQLCSQGRRLFYRHPAFADSIEEFPGIGRATASIRTVVKPIDFHRRNFARLGEAVFDPLTRAAMVPPGKTGN